MMGARIMNVSDLLNRAGKWETKCKQAAARDDYDRAGKYRTKALQLSAKDQDYLKKAGNNIPIQHGGSGDT